VLCGEKIATKAQRHKEERIQGKIHSHKDTKAQREKNSGRKIATIPVR